MRFMVVLSACLGLAGCAEEIGRDATEAAFNPVHVGASSRYLSAGVSVSLAEAAAWGMQAPMIRGGTQLRGGMGNFAMQRLRYDDYDLALVETDATAAELYMDRDVAGPVEMATGCRVSVFDRQQAEPIVGRRVIPLEC